MIEVSGLHAGYQGHEVLRGVDLDIPDGGFLGILGPNACGKSTLLKVLTGGLVPTRGSVRVAGREVAATPARDLARNTATVPQSTAIPFPFTGFEIVLMGRYPRLGRFARETREDLQAVERALDQTDTRALAERLITAVSGGERQRVILARAVAQEAPLLLLDEATSAMDIHRKVDAFELLAELNRQGATVVAVLHDLNLAALYCRNLLLMRDGRALATGATEQVFTAENLQATFGTPVHVERHPATGRPHVVFLRPQPTRDIGETLP